MCGNNHTFTKEHIRWPDGTSGVKASRSVAIPITKMMMVTVGNFEEPDDSSYTLQFWDSK
jgi:hypothetical protein